MSQDDYFQQLIYQNQNQIAYRQDEFQKLMHEVYSQVFCEQLANKLKDLISIKESKKNQIITKEFLQYIRYYANNLKSNDKTKKSRSYVETGQEQIKIEKLSKAHKKIAEQNKTVKSKIAEICEKLQRLRKQQQNCSVNIKKIVQQQKQQLLSITKKLKEHSQNISKNSDLQLIKEKQKQTNQNDLKLLKKDNHNLISRISAIDTQLSNEQIKNQNLLSQYQSLTAKMISTAKYYEDKIQKLNWQLKEQRQAKKILSDKLLSLQSQIQKIQQKQKLSQINQYRLLQGQILQKSIQQRKFLLAAIQKPMKKSITRTQLLYKYDSLNNVNFHNYIDNKPNLLFIAQLQNKYRVAAFSSGQIAPKKPSQQYGILISLTNGMIFEPQSQNPNYKSLIYEQFYFLFGNSQLRLKTNSDTIFSNFGILSRFFQKKEETVDILFGNGNQRQAKLLSYQFYQVYFQ